MTSEPCDHGGEAAAWVLGLLTPAEADRFAQHLERCPGCRHEVARLQRAADALPDLAGAARPPQDLRGRIMSGVEQEAALFRAAAALEVDVAEPRPSRRRGILLVLPAVAVATVLAVLAVGAALSGESELVPQERTFRGSVRPEAGGPVAGAAVRAGKTGGSRLLLSDLAAPPEGRLYQAWVVRESSQVDRAGPLFVVGSSKETTIGLPELDGARQVILTSEIPDGDSAPTLPPVAVVPLDEPGA